MPSRHVKAIAGLALRAHRARLVSLQTDAPALEQTMRTDVYEMHSAVYPITQYIPSPRTQARAAP